MRALRLLAGWGTTLGLGLAPAAAAAATIDVTTTADEYVTGAECSLREAVYAANADLAFGGCAPGSGADVISVPPGTYALVRTGPEGAGSTQFNDLDVVAPVTIQNGGIRPAVIDGGGNDRVLETSASGAGVSLAGLTIQGGVSAAGGGGIRNSGALAIVDSTLRDNFADNSEGGGILNEGTVSVENVTVSGNRADESGGGLSMENGPNSIQSATITGNVADADAAGGPTVGGGVFGNVSGTTLRDTIVAGNEDGSPTPLSSECAGQGLGSDGNNLIGDPGGCDFFGPHPGSDILGGDARLQPLADNGGPAATHALMTGSDAIDRASTAAAATDQRGAPRAGAADIGAYELVSCAGVVVNRVGTGARDLLRGTSGRDGILALAGRDRLRGLGGRDSLCGGAGGDRLLGGRGRDTLLGQAGRDVLIGGPGRDRLRGGPGRDIRRQ